jgi:hypothetical protein
LVFCFLVFFPVSKYAQSDWYEKESSNFKIIYRIGQAYLVNHILNSAENALIPLKEIFDYTPTEKIVITVHDIYDYGFATTTSVPRNHIRLEIEPFEPGYENIPYTERFQWVISHELVHIAVNDKPANFERITRALFSKAEPEQIQPLTVFFSLLTSYKRYTPRWHQESIAVYLETWLNGGYGRLLGNFDEMYFRCLVADNKEFPSDLYLDSKLSHTSFLLETLSYLYGGRFASYLALRFDPEKLFEWYKKSGFPFLTGFKSTFEDIFKISFDNAWKDFIKFEKNFQRENINKLKSSELSTITKILDEPVGWISQPYYDHTDNSIIFSHHQPHNLAAIKKVFLSTGTAKEIGTLQTPSLYQVSSTAYDQNLHLFFYTTNNNQFYRDLWMLEPSTKKSTLLFEDCRIGQLTVSQTTHELWGIQHAGAKASLLYSEYPYKKLESIAWFKTGEEIHQLAISPTGKLLAAVLHRSNGEQILILINADKLKSTGIINYISLSEKGSPDNPSWSPDEKFIFWNAYTNGVSNIYRFNLENKEVEPLSNTIRGLFKPIFISNDYLFAFEFTSDGFYPVQIENKSAKHLPAINYLGQQIVKVYPHIMDIALHSANPSAENSVRISKTENYKGLLNLGVKSFIPVVTGFQKQKVLGIFTHFSDPLNFHDFILEAGYSPFNENPLGPKWHAKFEYEYLKKVKLKINYNAPDFFDLFNSRKRGMMGTLGNIQHTHYWIYDNPHKLKQQTNISIYKDVRFINDNLIRVMEDFMVVQTSINSKNQRKSIGSSDYEYGDEYNFTFSVFASSPKKPQLASQIYADWSHLTTWFWDHNIFHFKFGFGHHFKNDRLMQSGYFFGGFGNREVEDAEVKQFRNLFRFPALQIYSLYADSFLKIHVENTFPPVRLGGPSLCQHYLDHMDFSVYSQSLLIKSNIEKGFVDLGSQLNLIFKHWYNLESTFSGGIAMAWYENSNSWDWFLSYKLLKNL